MKQLTGLDATFLHMETGSQFGHVSGLSIFERPEDPSYEPFKEWRRSIQERLHLLEPLRRRAVEVPFGIDHPFWIEDPDFDLDYHVRHTAVPPPGGPEELEALVARIVGRPLDRRHPLWETYVIEGLADDRFAVLTKFHHATIDGASGVELLTMMLDDTAEGQEVPPPTEAWRPEPVPDDLELLTRAMASVARKPGRLLLLSARTMRDLGVATRNPVLAAAGSQMRRSLRGPIGTVLNIGRSRDMDPDTPPTRLPTSRAPRTPFNRSITAHRRCAFRSTSLNQVKEIKQALGATVNDVVMAACAGGLRRYLESHDALPEKPLVAMVPVSIRTGEEAERWTNRVSGLVASLPTDTDEPLERLQRIHEAMGDAKEAWGALPAEALSDFAQFSPPAVFTRAMRMSTRFRLGDRLNPTVNLVVSNVPGPRQPLYAAGAKLEHYYPVSIVIDGQGLNITVQSYQDKLDWGLISCRDLIPDLSVLLDYIIEDLDGMEKVAKELATTG